MTRRKRGLTLALAILATACSTDPAGPDQTLSSAAPLVGMAAQSEESLNFLRPAAGAPSLAQKSLSFYAVRGRDREAEIWYHPRAGMPDSSRLVRLKLDKRSLASDAAGNPIAEGDSLLITMTVIDTMRLIVELEPSGLVFAPSRESKLTLWYVETDADLNQDGVVDATDLQLETTLGIWLQEQPGDPWHRLSGVLDTGEDQIETEITGFTRYAVSY